jgi:hypothetical protein
MIDDDGSADLFNGFWPFMKRVLMLFLPLWVFLIAISAKLPLIASAILAGLSVSLIAYLEKKKMMQNNKAIEKNNSVIK